MRHPQVRLPCPGRGASLSDTAGAHNCRAGCWKRIGHSRPSNRSISIGASRSAIRRREPAGRRRQPRHRSRRPGPPDGYTLLLANGANTINATLYDKLNFDFIRDIAPINRLAIFSFVMEVNPSVPTRDLPRVHRLRQGQSGQDQYGNGRQRVYQSRHW
jgi:hypothetical protein